MLYGYATAVFGRYTINDSKIQFHPNRRDLFEIYGHRSPQIEGDESRWQFTGFEEGYLKQQENTEWKEILEWKAQYAAMVADLEHSYTDDETQIEYHKIPVQKNSGQKSASLPLAASTIFHTECEGSPELWPPNTENGVNAEASFFINNYFR
ncbi:hypothetical protein [Sphingobacterium sp. SGR-19]|uniref:hypothetical protein n=1 Tax=Sphingobacterium sp. SGR-19 TaxID=2710886 RepID=UPI0013EDAC6C|nr:hypothetical protein [Sphingobacterium sp. SGR-19]NGM65403.1 hypothetical protein [Sphingobacterium sp. SGR-19]